ncbi:hypothetical protein, partial [Staphylococcus aureus]
ANGAYNIARKVLWAIGQFKKAEDEKLDKVKIAISNKEWLEYAQTSVKHKRPAATKKAGQAKKKKGSHHHHHH